jgi:hypothetical protein
MTKEERIIAAEAAKEKSLTHFMDEVALIEIRAVSPNYNWTDWADWHRYLYPSTAQSFKAFREAAERYAKHRVELAIIEVKGAEAEAESKWVSVQDRLPELSFNNKQASSDVLVYIPSKERLPSNVSIGGLIQVAYYTKDGWHYEYGEIMLESDIKNLTHWQPLPQPPLNQQ